MHQGRDVNELYDHGQVDVSRIDVPRSATGKQSQQRAKTFAAAADSINNVTLDCWIECGGLLRNARFNRFEMGLNQICDFSQTKHGRSARLGNCGATRPPVRAGEEFHEARITGWSY